MDQWIYWVVTTAFTLLLGALSWFVKRTLDELRKENDTIRKEFSRQFDTQAARMDKLEAKLQDTIESMPYKYTLRDDFIRSMAGVENKLNKILDKLSGITGGAHE